MGRVQFSKGVKTSPTDTDKFDRILEANTRTRRNLHRTKQSRRAHQAGGRRGQELSVDMDVGQGPLSGVVRYLARRMERGQERNAHGHDEAAAGGHRRRRTLPVAAQVAVMTVALAALVMTTFQSGGPGATGTWRRMQAARVEIKSCVPTPKASPVNPVIAASYPGSGAKLTWKLLRGITGMWTGDDHDHNGWVGKGMAVSIKTHYPALVSEVTEKLWEDISARSKRVIILLRHPLNALPSYHNFEYEQRNNLPNHSTRAPLEAWEQWRDGTYREQLGNWERLVRHYMEHFGLEDRLVVQFEKMSSKDQDVSLAEVRRIGKFLKDGDDRIELVEESNLPCVWETIVADKRVGFEGKRRHSLRKGGAVKYPFKPEQLDDMEAMLRRLSEYWQLKPAMEEYLEMIEDERRELARPKDAVESGDVMEERALKARASLRVEQQQPLSGTGAGRSGAGGGGQEGAGRVEEAVVATAPQAKDAKPAQQA